MTQSQDSVATQPEHKFPDSAITKQLHTTRHPIDIGQALKINFRSNQSINFRYAEVIDIQCHKSVLCVQKKHTFTETF